MQWLRPKERFIGELELDNEIATLVLAGPGSLSLVVGPPRWTQANLTGAGSVKRKSNGLCAW